MPYNPKIHNRRSIRLKGYDYSQAGLYFVTICCQGRVSYFGFVEDGKMKLNDAGKMVEKWYWKLENKFPDIKCHEMVVMPNHFHCIIENTGSLTADLPSNPHTSVRADPRVCPDPDTSVPADPRVCPDPKNPCEHIDPDEHIGRDEHLGSSLPGVVQWFKTMTTNEYIRGVKTLGWKRFNRKLWQRNYWENIIRNELSYHRISNYIRANPKKWKKDKFSD